MSEEAHARARFLSWYDGLKPHRKGFPALGSIAGALVVLERMKENPSCDISDFVAAGKAQIKGAGGRSAMKAPSFPREGARIAACAAILRGS